MNDTDMGDDGRFEAMLRELGPEVPRPELDAGARARLMATIGGDAGVGARAPVRRARWPLAAGLGLVAVLGVACGLLSVSLGRVRHELAASRWETGEALTLLMRARQTQPIVPVAADLGEVEREDLVLITFDHELCPVARVCTPGFRELAERHAGDAARFVVFDVTGEKRETVEGELDSLGVRYALHAPLGAETGVVKVLDMRRGRVLSSAPGARGLEQAEAVLARVTGADAGP